MNVTKTEIKEGIKLHVINTNKFKTNLLAIFITVPLERKTVTLDAMIPAVLRRGTMNMKTTEEISINLEEMYGAEFNCGIEKTGDNHVMKFYLEVLNDKFLPEKEGMLKNAIDKIFEIVFNPLQENNSFNEEYVNQEKNTLEQIIKAKIDNKSRYAYERTIEEMYKEKPYGLFNYGYIEDIEKINGTNLYEYYINVINNSKIDIFVSGDLNDEIDNMIKSNENFAKLMERKPNYNIDSSYDKEKIKEIKIIEEKMEINQGKLVIGMDINSNDGNTRYTSLVYNAILGGTPNSKMFQNVREKASLAYSANSNYIKSKGNILIRCGIEIENYEKAVDIIKEQIEDMKKGNFSDEDIENAKCGIIATIKTIPEEQDTEISYYLGMEISNTDSEINEYINNIESVSKNQIIELANKIDINIIYFLRN